MEMPMDCWIHLYIGKKVYIYGVGKVGTHHKIVGGGTLEVIRGKWWFYSKGYLLFFWGVTLVIIIWKWWWDSKEMYYYT